MALPIGPYQGQDLINYEAGNKFLPRQFYSLNSPIPTNTMGNTGGITSTQAAGSYMGYPSYEAWLLAQGGGGGGGGGGNGDPNPVAKYDPNQNLGPTNITDYEADAYGVGSTFKGSLAQLKDLYSKLPTPGNLIMKGIRHWKTRRAEKKAAADVQAKAAADQAAKTEAGIGPTTGQGGSINPGDLRDIGGGFHEYSDSGTAAGYEGSFAQGGRIGYATRGFVDPEEPAENIFEIMQDQNIPFSEQVEGGPTEEQVSMVIDMDGKGMDMETIISITGLGQDVITQILGAEMAQGGIARLL